MVAVLVCANSNEVQRAQQKMLNATSLLQALNAPNRDMTVSFSDPEKLSWPV
jgi:hypothetical protein